MQRIQSIDILKLFAMFLVIWGHCVQFMLTSNHLDEPAFVYIYSFHMPLFLMVSGLFAHRSVTSARECGTWLLVKARQLLLPCIAWGLLMSFGNLLLPLINGTHPDKSLLSTLWTNFWFLKSLFICFCLWYASLALLRKPWLAALVSILISQCIVAQEVQWSYPSFVTGVLISAHLDDLRRYRTPVALTALLIGGLLLLGWNKSYFLIPSVYTWQSSTPADCILNIVMRLYRYAVNISLSLGFLSLFLNLDSLNTQHSTLNPQHSTLNPQLSTLNSQPSTLNTQPSTLNYLSSLGQLTLGIYIIHSLIIMVRERLCPTLLCCDSLNPWLFNIVVAPLVAAMLLLVSIGITRLIMRLPHLSFFFLGTPWPKQQSASTGK